MPPTLTGERQEPRQRGRGAGGTKDDAEQGKELEEECPEIIKGRGGGLGRSQVIEGAGGWGRVYTEKRREEESRGNSGNSLLVLIESGAGRGRGNGTRDAVVGICSELRR